jgi:hypothetical protein
MEKVLERKTLRNELLDELYEYNFNNKGFPQRISKDDLDVNVEKALAYDYLSEKGLIRVDSAGGRLLNLKITAYGIDVVESN